MWSWNAGKREEQRPAHPWIRVGWGAHVATGGLGPALSMTIYLFGKSGRQRRKAMVSQQVWVKESVTTANKRAEMVNEI